MNRLIKDEEIKKTLSSYITSINALQVTWNTYKSIDDWGKERDAILGKMAYALTGINQIGNEKVLDWVLQVASLTSKIVNMIGSYYATIANADYRRNEYVRSVVNKAFSGGFKGQPLSQTAINAARSVAGISSVLIGARTPEYVDDVLEAMKHTVPYYDRADWLGMKLH